MSNTERFPIGFWNYPSVTAHTPDEVKVWADCGMTHTMTPSFSYAHNVKEQLLGYLDKAAEYGMKMIVTVSELAYCNAMTDGGRAKYRENFIRAYADFGHHPAVTGFSIGDEPANDEQNAACTFAFNTMLEIAPELTPFLNFLPFIDLFKNDICKGRPVGEWAKEFREQTGCKMLCYDCYTQLNPEIEGTEFYFENLRVFNEMSQAAGVPYWSTLLSVGHFRYRVPSEDDLRWQLNTAVASGAKGILWFLFYTDMNNNNYRLGPIDEFGDKTQTYTALSRVLRKFDVMHGKQLYPLKFKTAYHYGRAFGGWERIENLHHDLIIDVKTANNTPAILSLFEDGNGKEYVTLTSNSPFETDLFNIKIKPGTKCIRHGLNGSGSVDFAEQHHDAIYQVSDDGIDCGFFLAPGQMELLELSRA